MVSRVFMRSSLLISPLVFLICRLTDHKLNCEQTKAVLATFFGLGDVRVNAVRAIYPRLTDPQNFKSTVLVESFKYDDERSQVVQALGL